MCLILSVPGPCEPEDLIDGIIFAANYLGSTQLLSERNPSKNIRMMQAQEAVSRVKVQSQTVSVISESLECSKKKILCILVVVKHDALLLLRPGSW